MTQYRKGLPPVPPRMRHLSVDERLYPIPWFVAYPDGEHPDFRVADSEKMAKAMRFGNCWVCGEQTGVLRTFVIGPMCVVNRTTAEPPCHLECARYSAIACPFLTLPKAKRNEANFPIGVVAPAGEMIKRNPGVTCLWTATEFALVRVENGLLYRLQEPHSVEWYALGLPATRDEILSSIDSGMPILREMATEQGERALEQLERQYQRMLPLLPADVPDELPETDGEAFRGDEATAYLAKQQAAARRLK